MSKRVQIEHSDFFFFPSMPVSLSGIIHHSHSFTRLEIYHHIYFIYLFILLILVFYILIFIYIRYLKHDIILLKGSFKEGCSAMMSSYSYSVSSVNFYI